MLENFAFGAALTIGTTFIHFACTVGVVHWIRSIERVHAPMRSAVTHAAVLAALILAMSLAAIVEAGLWAAFYVWVGALPNVGEALYFSLVTFTTLGYGDISLDADWRMLSALEATNGIILFGWTTALIVAALQRIMRLYGRSAPPS